MVEFSSGATFEGEEVRLVTTGGLSAVDVLTQAENRASIKAKTTRIRGDLFTEPPLNRVNKKIPSLCRTRGYTCYLVMLPTPFYSAEALGKPEAGVLTPPNFGVTVGGTVPDSHRSCVPFKPSLTLGRL